MNICNINFLNSFNYHQIYIIIYIKKNLYHKTKQIQFDYNTKHTTPIRKPRGKKYQPPQNYNPRFRTHKSNKKIKIKTTNLVIKHTTKSTKSNQRAKGKNNCIFHTQTTTEAQGQKKKKLSSISPIVGALDSGEFK